MDTQFNREQSVHPYLKHGPFIYVREAMMDITTKMFREQTAATSTHKFRSPEDVVTPFLYSGVIRAVDPVTRIHPKYVLAAICVVYTRRRLIDLSDCRYNVHVTVEPEDEMSKFVLLSLHGIPKPPKKEQVMITLFKMMNVVFKMMNFVFKLTGFWSSTLRSALTRGMTAS